MFGKPHGFKPRRFGWGLTPVSWQGWIYVLWTLGKVMSIWFSSSSLRTAPLRPVIVGPLHRRALAGRRPEVCSDRPAAIMNSSERIARSTGRFDRRVLAALCPSTRISTTFSESGPISRG